jgi:hypothetical protein
MSWPVLQLQNGLNDESLISGKGEIVLVTIASRQALESSQPPLQCVLGIKWQECEAGLSSTGGEAILSLSHLPS